jgi:hypothetical protein
MDSSSSAGSTGSVSRGYRTVRSGKLDADISQYRFECLLSRLLRVKAECLRQDIADRTDGPKPRRGRFVRDGANPHHLRARRNQAA